MAKAEISLFKYIFLLVFFVTDDAVSKRKSRKQCSNMPPTHTQACVHACSSGAPFGPLLFIIIKLLATAPSGFVHVFQLWTFPELWTLLPPVLFCYRSPVWMCLPISKSKYLVLTHAERLRVDLVKIKKLGPWSRNT